MFKLSIILIGGFYVWFYCNLNFNIRTKFFLWNKFLYVKSFENTLNLIKSGIEIDHVNNECRSY